MIRRIGSTEDSCPAKEFATADDDLPVCQDFAYYYWETDFPAQIGPKNETKCPDGESRTRRGRGGRGRGFLLQVRQPQAENP